MSRRFLEPFSLTSAPPPLLVEDYDRDDDEAAWQPQTVRRGDGGNGNGNAVAVSGSNAASAAALRAVISPTTSTTGAARNVRPPPPQRAPRDATAIGTVSSTDSKSHFLATSSQRGAREGSGSGSQRGVSPGPIPGPGPSAFSLNSGSQRSVSPNLVPGPGSDFGETQRGERKQPPPKQRGNRYDRDRYDEGSRSRGGSESSVGSGRSGGGERRSSGRLNVGFGGSDDNDGGEVGDRNDKNSANALRAPATYKSMPALARQPPPPRSATMGGSRSLPGPLSLAEGTALILTETPPVITQTQARSHNSQAETSASPPATDSHHVLSQLATHAQAQASQAKGPLLAVAESPANLDPNLFVPPPRMQREWTTETLSPRAALPLMSSVPNSFSAESLLPHIIPRAPPPPPVRSSSASAGSVPLQHITGYVASMPLPAAAAVGVGVGVHHMHLLPSPSVPAPPAPAPAPAGQYFTSPSPQARLEQMQYHAPVVDAPRFGSSRFGSAWGEGGLSSPALSATLNHPSLATPEFKQAYMLVPVPSPAPAPAPAQMPAPTPASALAQSLNFSVAAISSPFPTPAMAPAATGVTRSSALVTLCTHCGGTGVVAIPLPQGWREVKTSLRTTYWVHDDTREVVTDSAHLPDAILRVDAFLLEQRHKGLVSW